MRLKRREKLPHRESLFQTSLNRRKTCQIHVNIHLYHPLQQVSGTSYHLFHPSTGEPSDPSIIDQLHFSPLRKNTFDPPSVCQICKVQHHPSSPHLPPLLAPSPVFDSICALFVGIFAVSCVKQWTLPCSGASLLIFFSSPHWVFSSGAT